MSSHDDTRMGDSGEQEQEQKENGSLFVNADESHRHSHDSHHRHHGHHSHRSHHHRHSHHDDHGLRHKQEKRDKSGAKMLDQLTSQLQKTTLHEDDNNNSGSANQQPEDGKPRKKRRRKIKAEKKAWEELTNALENTSMNEKVAPTTRSMTGMLPLGFNSSYLKQAQTGMNNDQIVDWIKSVYVLHIESWLHDCLDAPENQAELQSARQKPLVFASTVLNEMIIQHNPPESVGETDQVPTSLHADLTQHNNVNLVPRTAKTAYLIARDGKRGGEFATCEDEVMIHRAAVMLLVTLIKARSTQEAKGRANRVARGLGDGSPARTLFMSAVSLDAIGGAYEEVQRDSGCSITVRRHLGTPDAPCMVELTGTDYQMDEAQQFITKLVESVTVSSEMELE